MLAAAAARRFYLDGRSKIQIADELGVSRFKVARLLASARTSGLVRIEVVLPSGVDGELSELLRTTYRLRHAIVVATEELEAPALRDLVGRVGADLLTELAVPGDVIGLAWGRSLRSMTQALTALPRCQLVQLSGVLARPDVDENALELVRQAAAVAGGRATGFYAPLVVDDAATATSLRQQPGIRDALSALDTLTKAVVSIGAWRAGDSTVFDELSARDREALAQQGVVAETTGILFDGEGRPLDALSDRVIGVSAEQLRRTPEVVALAYSDTKAAAVRSILSSGLVSSLVTHDSLARAVLAE